MWIDIISSFFISSSVSIVNNVQRKYIYLCGLAGVITMSVYSMLSSAFGATVSSLIACIALSLFSHTISHVTKLPNMIFVVSGVMPILPGGILFKAVNALAKNDYSQASLLGGQALLVGFAIAIGFLIDQVFAVLLKRVMQRMRTEHEEGSSGTK